MFKQKKYNLFFLMVALVFLSHLTAHGQDSQHVYEGTSQDTQGGIKKARQGTGPVTDARIIGKIFSLPEVRATDHFIDSMSNHKRSVSIIIMAKPHKKNKYFWVQAGDNNEIRFEPYFNFYVSKDNLSVLFFDPMNNITLTLGQWRKNLLSRDSSKRTDNVMTDSTNGDTSHLVMAIHFQKDFKNDTVLLKINDEIVFKNVVITSITFLDFAQLTVDIVKNKKGNMLAMYEGKKNTDGDNFYGKTKIKKLGNIVKLVCEVNGHISVNVVDISIGKFVGLNKNVNDSISYRQRTTAFQYD